MLGWILAIAAAALAGYLAGRRAGILNANRSAVIVGSWVEVARSVSCRPAGSGRARKLPVGTQAVVTGIDKWGRVSLWVAHPWAPEWKPFPEVHDITDLAGLRAKPLHGVPTEIRDRTFDALITWATKVQETEARLFPPGFLELQRLLNRT